MHEDLDGDVRLIPNYLRSRAGLDRTLSDYNLSIDGTVPTLKKRLSQHLVQLEARVTKNMLQTNVRFRSLQLYVWPATTCYCADDGHRALYQIQLERNGVTTNGKLRKLIAYPESSHHLESIAKSDSSVAYFAAEKTPHCNGGLYCFDMESCEVTKLMCLKI